MLKITHIINENKVAFGNLKKGDVFKYADKFWLKIKKSDTYYANVVNLSNMEFHSLEDETMIVPMAAELTICEQ